jgi:hypothetical protein
VVVFLTVTGVDRTETETVRVLAGSCDEITSGSEDAR